MKLYIDIETIPTRNQAVIDAIRNSIKHPGNISKQETIDKWYAENKEACFDAAYRKTALDGLYGEIISIAYALDDSDPCVLHRVSGESEADLLKAFFEDISIITDSRNQRGVITQWIGHYITGFDLRFIWQRCVINRIIPSVKIPYDAKPWDDAVFDTKIEWTGASSSYSGAGSMKALAPVFGLHKNDIDGSMVYDMWIAEKYDEIAEYNKRDVIDCRILHKRMTFQG